MSSGTKALEIVKMLKGAGFEAYLVGGCVRDRLMGIKPKDFDIATSAKPAEIASIFPNSKLVGASFGVVIVVLDGSSFEVATFREDSSYTDGRHPDSIKYSDMAHDARRRDFTINALYEDPENGRIIDLVGGRQDIEKGLVRTIGDPEVRFGEDLLRLLRAVRFASRFKFSVEEKTAEAMKKLAPGIRRISAERVFQELTIILTQKNPASAFELLDEIGLIGEIIPELPLMQGVEQPPEFHPEGDVWVHTMKLLSLMSDDLEEGERTEPALAWAGLLHDIGKPVTFEIRDRIRFNNHPSVGAAMAVEVLAKLKAPGKLTEEVRDLILFHLSFKDIPKMRIPKLKRTLRKENFDLHMKLHRLDCLASHGDLSILEFCREKLGEYGEEELKPTPLVTGEDLKRLGYLPGPIFREILSEVESGQLDGTLHETSEALEWIRENYPAGAGRKKG